jgi:hypothetical protein
LAFLTAIIFYAAATKNCQPAFIEKGRIEKRKLKEDSTATLMDIQSAKVDDMFHYRYEKK